MSRQRVRFGRRLLLWSQDIVCRRIGDVSSYEHAAAQHQLLRAEEHARQALLLALNCFNREQEEED